MRVWRPQKPISKKDSPHDHYALKCVCGEILTGARTTNAQELSCPQCSLSHYVLPIDVYPRPQIVEPVPEPPKPELKITFAEAVPEQDIDLTLDEDSPPVRDTTRLAEPQDDTPERIWIDRPHGGQIRKRILQLFALTGVILLVMTWAVSHRKFLQQSETQFREQNEAAWEQLDRGEWDSAYASATSATKAARDLGRDDPVARDVAMLQQEFEIVERLSSLSAAEIVDQKSAGDYDRTEWLTRFRVHHAENWLLMQGELVREPAEDGFLYSFEFPVSMPEQQVALVCDASPAWVDNLTFTENRASAFCAFKMQAARFVNEGTSTWEIVLSAQDSHLWTQPRLLRELFGVDLNSEENAELNELILSQRDLYELGEQP